MGQSTPYGLFHPSRYDIAFVLVPDPTTALNYTFLNLDYSVVRRVSEETGGHSVAYALLIRPSLRHNTLVALGLSAMLCVTCVMTAKVLRIIWPTDSVQKLTLMLPFVDTHCHLCAGMDDGPKDADTALEMCQIAWNEGTRWIAALAHQNEHWPDNSPDRIINSVGQLAAQLAELDVPLNLVPTGEVMISAEIMQQWEAGELLSYGKHNRYLLVEYPHGLFLDIRQLSQQMVQRGVRPVIAHAERQPELLHEHSLVDQLIHIGCIIQVSTMSLIAPANGMEERALKRWIRRGVAHVVGSDGHSPRSRKPVMAEAYERIRSWSNEKQAEQICVTNGMALMEGKPLKLPPPQEQKRSWFSWR